MSNDETDHAVTGGDTEERVPVQGSIESVGIREVLRIALAHAPSRLVLRDAAGAETELWCTDAGYGTTERATGPEEVLAEALSLRNGTFAITEESAPAFDAVPPADALAAAEALAPLWAEVVATIPDRTAAVRLRRRVPSPVDVTATQWRVLAHVGRGRGIADLAVLLRSSERASRRVVAELVSAGLVEVVHVAVPLTAPPAGAALAPPTGAAPMPPPAAFAAPATAPVAADADADRTWAAAASATPAASPAPDRAWEDHAAPPSVVDSWATVTEPPATSPAWSWDAEPSDVGSVEPAADAETRTGGDVHAGTAAHPWDDAVTPDDGPIEWDPEPEPAPGQPAVAPVSVPGFIEDPVALSDEVLGSTDEELVNRALLFKFLSSVRE